LKDYNKIYAENKPLFDEIYASICKHDTVKLTELLTARHDLIDVPVYGDTSSNKNLLHYAAEHGSREICVCLIDAGIEVNSLNSIYDTPLNIAASRGQYEIVKELLSRGAWVDGDGRCAATPLIEAARGETHVTSVDEKRPANREGYFEIVGHLIDCGAEINRLQSNFNRTAIEMAQSYGREEVAELLRSKGAQKAIEDIDLSIERAPGVLSCIDNRIGWIMSYKLSKDLIDLRTALLKSNNEIEKKNKVLFTIGAFEKVPSVEFLLCVPFTWPVNRQIMEVKNVASFPMQLLFSLAEYRLTGEEFEEGYIIEKYDAKWSHLIWPEKLDGFVIVDYVFDTEAEPFDDSDVLADEMCVLFLLIPIKYPKAGRPNGKKYYVWLEKCRTKKWGQNALKYDHLNDEEKAMIRWFP